MHKAVIGSLYGDEGKGLMTDFFANQAMEDHDHCTVIRSNGGCQAGHTVQTRDSRRHVFHHFGSGSLAGARTHLSRFMIVNPIMFNREWDQLITLGVQPVVTMSPDCQVTFPQDMLLNQMLETMRGNTRHGSCGLGISETIERGERHQLPFYLRDWRPAPGLMSFKNHHYRVLLARIADLGYTFDDLPEEYRQYIADEDVFRSFLREFDLMMDRITLVHDSDVPKMEPIIFEAAQGLGLDEHMGWFPYVTRSKTGLFNISQLCRDMGIDDIEAVYAMRAYTTRHGAGPLDGENLPMTGYDLTDPTNQPNNWQGTLRFAPLDLWLADRLITLDLAGHRNRSLKITKSVAVTCLDQAPDWITVFNQERKLVKLPKDCAVDKIKTALGAENGWASYGPTRDTVFEELRLVA